MKIPEHKFAGDEKGNKDNEVADLETALSLTRTGKFHTLLVAIGGLSILTSGFEYGLHAYTLPYAQCDLQMSTAEMGVINVMFMAGGLSSIVCSIFCGAIADLVGRRKVMMTALFFGGINTIISSFSTSYIMFAAFRFISGFMSGAGGCLIFSYIGEFCSDKYRSTKLCLIGFAWNFAWLLLPLSSWLIIPSPLGFETSVFKYGTWRVFVALVGGVPCIISSILLYCFCTEPPKLLFVHGREAEAIEILKKMYHMNTGNPPENYPVKKLVTAFNPSVNPGAENTNNSPISEDKNIKDIIVMVFSQMKQVFRPPYLKKSLLAASIYFSIFFGFYGLGLWLPELFNRFQAYYAVHPDTPISVCKLSHFTNLTLLNYDTEEMLLSNLTSTCYQRPVNLAIFTNTFLVGTASSVGNIIAILSASKLGGRILTIFSMLVAGISAILIYFSIYEIQIVIVNCFFMGSIGTAMTTIGSCVINLFPTSIRAGGFSIALLFGRLGAICSNLIFGYLLDISCEVPFFFLGGTILCGGLLCFLLPKDSQKAVE